MHRPVIFISAVSKELRSARQLVANTLTYLGYEPEWQDIFGTEQGNLRAMLRRRIDACAGVVQIIGNNYGFEPTEPDAEFGRVSYTQYEALYARQRGKPVWCLLVDDAFPRDERAPESEESRNLQATYRARNTGARHLTHSIADASTLENRVLKLRDDLSALRRGVRRWALAASALLLLSATLLTWQHFQQRAAEQTHQEDQKRLAAGMESQRALQEQSQAKLDELLRRAVPAVATAESDARRQQGKDDPAAAETRAYEMVAKSLGIDPMLLREKLPAYAAQLQQSPAATAFERANAAYLRKDYPEAERLALEAADVAEHAAPPRTADAYRAYRLAGAAADARIEYAAALRHYRAAERHTNRKSDAEAWAQGQGAIAYVLLELGRYDEAAEQLQEVVPVFASTLGAEHPDTLSSRGNLAGARQAQGRYAEAEAEHREVLAVRERVLGTEHPDTLSSRGNIAVALQAQGRYAEAEAEHRKVLAVRERVLGAEHPDTLKNRNNLAGTLQAQGRYAEAEAEHREVLAVRERVLGAEHPETLSGRNNLAVALAAQGRYAEAEAEHRNVLAARERVLGVEHPDTLNSRNNLAEALHAQGRNVEAVAEHRKVLAARERVLGAEHPHTLTSRHNLANALSAQDRYAEALVEHRRVLAARERVLGIDHPDTLNSRGNLAAALQAQGRYVEAEAEQRKVLVASERVLGAEHPDTLITAYNLALLLKSQGKFDEALSFAVRARNGWLKIQHRNSKRAIEIEGEIREALAKRAGAR